MNPDSNNQPLATRVTPVAPVAQVTPVKKREDGPMNPDSNNPPKPQPLTAKKSNIVPSVIQTSNDDDTVSTISQPDGLTINGDDTISSSTSPDGLKNGDNDCHDILVRINDNKYTDDIKQVDLSIFVPNKNSRVMVVNYAKDTALETMAGLSNYKLEMNHPSMPSLPSMPGLPSMPALPSMPWSSSPTSTNPPANNPNRMDDFDRTADNISNISDNPDSNMGFDSLDTDHPPIII